MANTTPKLQSILSALISEPGQPCLLRQTLVRIRANQGHLLRDSNPTIFLKTQHYDRPGSLTNEAIRPAESTLTEKPKLAP